MLLVSRNHFSQGFVYEIQINMLYPHETWRTKNMTITFYLLNNIYHISSIFFLWIKFVCTHFLLCSSGHCRERHWYYLRFIHEEITTQRSKYHPWSALTTSVMIFVHLYSSQISYLIWPMQMGHADPAENTFCTQANCHVASAPFTRNSREILTLWISMVYKVQLVNWFWGLFNIKSMYNF